ncbi:hypothetical protein SCLCIDRAFT_1209192 [Scleroderma citrinum Foug A]|uniref:Uncharacterized protein n=1 Tax=Scleroderma citrinum Foug A TaxID=1036808 RepID=A0A0C3EKC7_9AGAM|nr:hypothetical protein SCLCIDRAFT_1209192 [Scleroderma citrinum Foug A]
MKPVALLAAVAAIVPVAFGLTVNTPGNVVECEPTEFDWSGGQAPYYISLIPGGQISAPPIKEFPNQEGTSYTWLVDLPVNTIFNFALKDSLGATSYSDILTIGAGSSTSCVNTTVQEGTTASPSATSAASHSGTVSGTAAASTATHSSSADRMIATSVFGVGAILGVVGAAFL